MDHNRKETLYDEITQRVITLISQGILKPGEKIPSIREMSTKLGVSINTVKESYYQLENDRYIEAVPQSGYYVCTQLPPSSTGHNRQDPVEGLNPTRVSLCALYGAFKERNICAPGAELGIAAIDPKLWPAEKLYKFYLDALKCSMKEIMDYCVAPGLRNLREQIALFSMKNGINGSADDYIITEGCSEALYLALSAVLEKGDTIAVESPIYFNLLHLCDMLKLNVVEIPSDAERGISLETLEFVLEHHDIKAVLVISAFSNPSGALMSTEKMRALVDLTARHGVPLIEDMIYSELYYDGKPPQSCKSFDRSGNVLLCSSFSKFLAPGIRVGWINPGKYREIISKNKTILNIGTSVLPQMAVSRSLQEGGVERYLRNLRKTVKTQVETMRATILETFPDGTEVLMPQGGFLLWVQMPEKVDANKLYAQLIGENIIIAPGSMFTMTGKYPNYMRLNAGFWNSSIEHSLEIIGGYARSQIHCA
ncbi:MAG: PLP-dependent aminotransferase family protein [Spirochaetales bacterium]|nr:PLP-dependent aminotransferase family protein [Spirochaetales bacterium]